MKGNPLYYATGGAVILSFIFVIWVLSFHDIPKENRDLFIHLLGIIEGSFVGGIVSSFFGSSKKEHEHAEIETSSVTETKTETETK